MLRILKIKLLKSMCLKLVHHDKVLTLKQCQYFTNNSINLKAHF